MATVYLARDLRHRRPVALKVLHPGLAHALAADRFLREIDTAANLNHPHILPLHDSGEVDGLLYYVMPFVEGESLRDRLNRDKPLPVAEAIRVAREVAEALDYAHGRSVVHRDIKPENILLSGGHALVADFGIARAVASGEGETNEQLTQTGMVIGTPAYMSPEQWDGCASLLEALLAAAEQRPDAGSRLARLDSLMQTGPPYRAIHQPWNLVVARLKEARGDVVGALAATRRRLYQDAEPLFLSTYLREEGRLAALTGDRAGATRAYAHYLELRADPEPGLQPRVQQVRAELAQLLAEPAR